MSEYPGDYNEEYKSDNDGYEEPSFKKAKSLFGYNAAIHRDYDVDEEVVDEERVSHDVTQKSKSFDSKTNVRTNESESTTAISATTCGGDDELRRMMTELKEEEERGLFRALTGTYALKAREYHRRLADGHISPGALMCTFTPSKIHLYKVHVGSLTGPILADGFTRDVMCCHGYYIQFSIAQLRKGVHLDRQSPTTVSNEYDWTRFKGPNGINVYFSGRNPFAKREVKQSPEPQNTEKEKPHEETDVPKTRPEKTPVQAHEIQKIPVTKKEETQPQPQPQPQSQKSFGIARRFTPQVFGTGQRKITMFCGTKNTLRAAEMSKPSVMTIEELRMKEVGPLKNGGGGDDEDDETSRPKKPVKKTTRSKNSMFQKGVFFVSTLDVYITDNDTVE
jgi:hypothetical protein